MRRLLSLLLPTLALVLTGCSITGTEEHVETMFIAPQLQECQGFVLQQCMLVKERPEDDWEFFFEGIEGFTFEPGYDYELVVSWRELENPPQDGSSRRYRLIRLVSKTPVA